MRKLIHIPSIHKHFEGLGQTDPDDEQFAQRLFEENKRFLENLEADFSKARVYLENVCEGDQLRRQLTVLNGSDDSFEGQLAGILIREGAYIEATENPDLFRSSEKIFGLWKESAKRGVPFSGSELNSALDVLIDARDASIAHHINSSLRTGEIGFLIIGAAHRAHLLLPPDIEVISQKSELVEGALAETWENVAMFRERGKER